MPRQQSQNRSASHPRGLTLKAVLGRLQREFEFKLAALKRMLTPDSVHEARTAARRLRALLHGYRRQLSSSSARRYRNALKRLTRELGTLRDADVAQQNVAALAKNAQGRHRDALIALSSGFDQRRHRLANKLQAQMARSAWSADVRNLKAAAADAALIRPDSLPIATVTKSLLAHRRRRMRSRLRRATRSKRALHRLRIKVKRLRYFLEEGTNIAAGLARARELQLLKDLQDCLGQIHDLVVLKKLSKGHDSPRIARKALRKKCDARWKRLLRNYHESRAELLHLWDTGNPASG